MSCRADKKRKISYGLLPNYRPQTNFEAPSYLRNCVKIVSQPVSGNPPREVHPNEEELQGLTFCSLLHSTTACAQENVPQNEGNGLPSDFGNFGNTQNGETLGIAKRSQVSVCLLDQWIIFPRRGFLASNDYPPIAPTPTPSVCATRIQRYSRVLADFR